MGRHPAFFDESLCPAYGAPEGGKQPLRFGSPNMKARAHMRALFVNLPLRSAPRFRRIPVVDTLPRRERRVRGRLESRKVNASSRGECARSTQNPDVVWGTSRGVGGFTHS